MAFMAANMATCMHVCVMHAACMAGLHPYGNMHALLHVMHVRRMVCWQHLAGRKSLRRLLIGNGLL